MNDEREFISADHSFPLASRSEIKMDFFEFAQVVRISVHQAGADFKDRLDDLEADALNKGAAYREEALRHFVCLFFVGLPFCLGRTSRELDPNSDETEDTG